MEKIVILPNEGNKLRQVITGSLDWGNTIILLDYFREILVNIYGINKDSPNHL